MDKLLVILALLLSACSVTIVAPEDIYSGWNGDTVGSPPWCPHDFIASPNPLTSSTGPLDTCSPNLRTVAYPHLRCIVCDGTMEGCRITLNGSRDEYVCVLACDDPHCQE